MKTKQFKSEKNATSNAINVENSELEVIESTVEVEGLESAETENDDLSDMPENVNYQNRKYLEENAPEFLPEFISKKFNEEREPKVQNGLALVSELLGDKINPLVLLLAKWWEVKPARATIKKLIDEEAASKNIPDDVYLQINLRENVDKLGALSQATDRMKYAINYFKPRAGVGLKDTFKIMSIDGENYNVSLTKLEKAKVDFPGDKEAIKTFMKSISEKIVVEDIL